MSDNNPFGQPDEYFTWPSLQPTLPAQLQAEIRKLVDAWSPFQSNAEKRSLGLTNDAHASFGTRSSLKEVATTNHA